jgi:hypothetical protein
MTNKSLAINERIILDLCGGTGAWSRPYKEAGYDVYNITLPDWDVRHYLITEDYLIFKLQQEELFGDLNIPIESIYGILAAPPCTIFSLAAWNKKRKDRDFEEGFGVVRACLNIIWSIQEHGAPLKFWALENPKGYLYNFLGFPVFYFQPWQFGETGFLATKRTAVWGYFKKPVKTHKIRTLPFINSHSQAKGQKPENKEWYTASSKERAITPPGFAQAFFEANR